MVQNLTLSTQTTRANAGVNAALVNTGTVVGTVLAGDALWCAGYFRSTVEIRQADTCFPVALNLTFGVGPAGRYAGHDWWRVLLRF